MTYFLARRQMEIFYELGRYTDIYMPPINVTILDDGGFESVTYTYYQLTPTSLSDFDMTYHARVGSFNTFTWGFSYNYFEIYYRDAIGNRQKYALDKDYGMLKHKNVETEGVHHDIIATNRNGMAIVNGRIVKQQ